MDTWQKHVYNDCVAFVDKEFEHLEHEPTISLGKREAYIVIKALEFQEKYENPILQFEPETSKVSEVLK